MNPSALFDNLYQEELYVLRPKVLIILSKNWNEVSDEDQSLLIKILNSIKLNLASVQIVTQKKFDIDELTAYSPIQILTFGSFSNSKVALYQLISLKGVSVLHADALHELNETKKKILWSALRQMFLQ